MTHEAASPEASGTPTDLIERIGAVAAGEFERARDSTKPGLLAWIDRVFALPDDEFLEECRSAIYGSASVLRFRGNFEDDHCKASACYHESARRLVAAGHDGDCRGPSLYSRAHAAVMRSHGYQPTPDGTCVCFEGEGD